MDKPKPKETLHRILVEFPDDHSISGIKIRADGLTPEQIMVACFHLERTANSAADYRTAQQLAAKSGATLDTGGGRGDLDIGKILADPHGGIRQ